MFRAVGNLWVYGIKVEGENVLMRPAQANDLTRIVEIYNATISSRMATADTEPVSVESRRPWFEKHTDRRPIFVMQVDDDVVGWASFENFYGRPAFHLTAELSVYVDERYRGRGIGGRLLASCIDRAPSLGLLKLVAYIFGHNSPSLSLFNKHGFTVWGTLPAIAEMDGCFYDVVILGRDLTGMTQGDE